MSVRTVVLFGALAWVSGSFLVVMHRGVLAEGRVAGVSIAATSPAGLGQAQARVPVGDAIVSLSNDKTLYFRRGGEVWRIADTATLQLLAKQVSAREGRSNLDGLKLVGTINSQNMGEILASPALTVQPQEPVGDDDDESGPTAGPLRLRVDSSTPASATLPDGTQLNSVLAIQVRSFSGLPVNLTSLTLTQEYAYLASTSTSTLPTSTTFDGATAWDGATRHGSRGVFGANLRATVDMSADPIVIPPLGTRVVLLKVDLPTYVPPRVGDYGVRLAVSAAGDISQTGGTALGAAFPLRGSLFSWVDGSTSLGQVQVIGLETSGYASEPSTTTEPNILTGEYPDMFRFQISENSSREDLEVQRIAMSIEGTVNPATDLHSFQLVAAGGTVATATAAVGRTVTFNLPSGWRIPQGQNRTFSVGADITGGVGQWFRFSIADQDSLIVRGVTTGMNLAPSADSWPLVSVPGYFMVGSQATSSDDVVPVVRSVWLSADGTVVNPGEHQAPLAAYVVTNPTDQALRFNVAVLNFDYATSTATSTLTNFALYRVDRASGTAQIVTTNVPQIYGDAINLESSGEVWLEPGASMDLELRADVAGNAQPGPMLSSSMPAWGIAFSAASGTQYRGPLARVVGQSVVVQVPTLNIRSIFSSPEEISSVILTGTSSRLLQTLRLVAYTEDGHLELNKITLQFDSSIGGIANQSGVHNLGTVRLYHDGILLGTAYPYQYGTTTADVAFIFPSPVAIPAWAQYDIDVRADIADSGSGADATQLMARIKSNSNSDIDVRGPAGQLPPSYVNIGPLNSPSSWFLVHDAAPTIVALPPIAHFQGTTDEVARFEVRNYGQVALRLDELKLNLAATGLRLSTTSSSTFDRVYDFGLYDDSGTHIANPAIWRMLSATTSTSTLRFSSSTSVNTGWEENAFIPAESFGLPGYRVFSLRANTLLINAAGGAQVRTLQAQVPGMRGHIEGLEVYESNWAYGGAVYRYVPAGYAEWRGPFSASDSYPVLGTVVSYN